MSVCTHHHLCQSFPGYNFTVQTDILTSYIDFSLVPAKGGFLHDDGWYSVEDTLCINIIGSSEDDIIKLGKSIKMIMNQECVLIVKNDLQTEFR